MDGIIDPYISPFQSSGSGFEDLKIFEMPFAAAPRFDHLRCHDVDQDLGERAPFRVALQVIGRLVPRKARVRGPSSGTGRSRRQRR